MGEFERDNSSTQQLRTEYLATLSAKEVSRLEAISFHRKVIGVPDWFCSKSSTHRHLWVQDGLGGSWHCKFCLDSVRSWPNISLLNVTHVREVKKKAAELLAEKPVLSIR